MTAVATLVRQRGKDVGVSLLQVVLGLVSIGGAALFGAFGRDLLRTLRRWMASRSADRKSQADQRKIETESTGKFRIAEVEAGRSAARLLQDLVKAQSERIDTLMKRIDDSNLRIDLLQEEVAKCERGRAADIARADRLEGEVIYLRDLMRKEK